MHCQIFLLVLRRVSGRSRLLRRVLTTQKQPKTKVFRQNSAGRAGESFSHVVSAFKISPIMFCGLKKFCEVLRRTPAIYERLKNGHFFQKQQKLAKNLNFQPEQYTFSRLPNPLKFYFCILFQLYFKIFYQSYINDIHL